MQSSDSAVQLCRAAEHGGSPGSATDRAADGAIVCFVQSTCMQLLGGNRRLSCCDLNREINVELFPTLFLGSGRALSERTPGKDAGPDVSPNSVVGSLAVFVVGRKYLTSLLV
jgi:hypothetical protein